MTTSCHIVNLEYDTNINTWTWAAEYDNPVDYCARKRG